MPKNKIKYFRIFLSVILLSNFIFTELSLCQIIKDDCKAMKSGCEERVSASCNDADTGSSYEFRSENSCCCEIKESSRQQSESNLNYTEIYQLQTLTASSQNFEYIGQNTIIKLSYCFNFSIHSPPGEKIHIKNSNFRI